MLKPQIRQLIKDKGMKQVFVAEKMDVTPQQLNSWIRGASYPRIDRAYKLAKVIGCKIEELYEEE